MDGNHTNTNTNSNNTNTNSNNTNTNANSNNTNTNSDNTNTNSDNTNNISKKKMKRDPSVSPINEYPPPHMETHKRKHDTSRSSGSSSSSEEGDDDDDRMMEHDGAAACHSSSPTATAAASASALLHESELPQAPFVSIAPATPSALSAKDAKELLAAKRAKPDAPKFLLMLYEILQNESDKVIRWTDDGLALQILEQTNVTEKVLPKYFNHTNFHSFQRQLNYFGFRKWTKSKTDICTFSHPYFRRNQPELMHMIKRKKATRRASSPAAEGQGDPLYPMDPSAGGGGGPKKLLPLSPSSKRRLDQHQQHQHHNQHNNQHQHSHHHSHPHHHHERERERDGGGGGGRPMDGITSAPQPYHSGSLLALSHSRGAALMPLHLLQNNNSTSSGSGSGSTSAGKTTTTTTTTTAPSFLPTTQLNNAISPASGGAKKKAKTTTSSSTSNNNSNSNSNKATTLDSSPLGGGTGGSSSSPKMAELAAMATMGNKPPHGFPQSGTLPNLNRLIYRQPTTASGSGGNSGSMQGFANTATSGTRQGMLPSSSHSMAAPQSAAAPAPPPYLAQSTSSPINATHASSQFNNSFSDPVDILLRIKKSRAMSQDNAQLQSMVQSPQPAAAHTHTHTHIHGGSSSSAGATATAATAGQQEGFASLQNFLLSQSLYTNRLESQLSLAMDEIDALRHLMDTKQREVDALVNERKMIQNENAVLTEDKNKLFQINRDLLSKLFPQ